MLAEQFVLRKTETVKALNFPCSPTATYATMYNHDIFCTVSQKNH